MKDKTLLLVGGLTLLAACGGQVETPKFDAPETTLTTIGNPYIPLWDHIPDGEPYVFEDPDNPGKFRVYVYGSHDIEVKNYCGRDQVVWSADVNDLNHWRMDGVILKVDKNGKGEPQKEADVLFAPDVTMVEKDGKKTYYLYPNNQVGGRNGMVAKSDRPDGPFEVINWSKANPDTTDGVLKFDPAVFVDDDGKVYGYWGFGTSHVAELDPETMATVKKGTKVTVRMIGGFEDKDDNEFRFFEASSIRKIKDKYVFIYSRFTKDGEFGLPTSNYTLAYAYSDTPTGPWTYGGTIIDGRAREKDPDGKVIPSATPDGNTHGSICEINGKWWVFYHRQNGLNEFSRQAMVAPITVTVEEGKGGKVTISEGEYTSEGFSVNGLNPTDIHPAGICCWYTGPKTAEHNWPNNKFYGSYVAAAYGTTPESNLKEPYALKNNINPVVNNTDGSIVGYKYFDFDGLNGKQNVYLLLGMIPQGIEGQIDIYIDRPWTQQGGKCVGTLKITPEMPQTSAEQPIKLDGVNALNGKHAVFLVFSSTTKETSICTLETIRFAEGK